MITCKECKYYVAVDKSCERWITGYSFDRSELPSNQVLVENDEGWGMVCGPDFGCILGERDLLQPTDISVNAGGLLSEGSRYYAAKAAIALEKTYFEDGLVKVEIRCTYPDGSFTDGIHWRKPEDAYLVVPATTTAGQPDEPWMSGVNYLGNAEGSKISDSQDIVKFEYGDYPFVQCGKNNFESTLQALASTTAEQPDDCRAAFESRITPNLDLKRNEDSGYRYQAAQMAFRDFADGWHAARACEQPQDCQTAFEEWFADAILPCVDHDGGGYHKDALKWAWQAAWRATWKS